MYNYIHVIISKRKHTFSEVYYFFIIPVFFFMYRKWATDSQMNIIDKPNLVDNEELLKKEWVNRSDLVGSHHLLQAAGVTLKHSSLHLWPFGKNHLPLLTSVFSVHQQHPGGTRIVRLHLLDCRPGRCCPLPSSVYGAAGWMTWSWNGAGCPSTAAGEGCKMQTWGFE